MEQAKPLSGVATYLREVVNEMRKVVWPTRDRVFKLTAVVVGMVILLSAFMYLIDYPLGILMTKVFFR